MTEAAILTLINTYIVSNGANEITADILRPILIAMLEQPNDKVGELADLDTTDKDNIVDAINEILSATGNGFGVHSGTADPNVTPPGSFSIGDWYIRNGASLYQYNGDTWVLLNSAGTVVTDDVEFPGAPLSNIPASTNDDLTTIIENIDTALGNRYTKTEADAAFVDADDLIDSTEIDSGNKLLVFKDVSDATLFTQDITEFVSQAVTIEVDSGNVQIKDADGSILSSAALPTLDTVEIDGHPFRYVVGIDNDGTSLQVGDIAAGGVFTWMGGPFFGDLICIDDTGDLTTGIGTKWEPLTPVSIDLTT